MDLTIAGLVFVSAVLHPLREILIKGNTFPEAAYLAITMLWVVFAGIHAVLLGVDPWSVAPVWPLVLFSCLGLFLYYLATMATIKRGDVSVYYPIIRSSPLAVVVMGFLFLGHRYPVPMLGGIALVLIGAFFLQYRRGAPIFHQPAVLAMAVVAMAGSGVYSLADSAAMRTVEPMAFLLWTYVLLVPCCAIYFMVTKPLGRSRCMHLFGGWRHTPIRYFAAGLLSYVSYYLILTAYQLGGNVAAVTSVRLVSVPLSVILSVAYLKEADIGARLLWSLVLVAGIVVIVVVR
ncbi:MAG: EamA family transporter [Alphaproteobacteria bacterium]|nr:EamA family transporter [Alphaproteobacteria bacterium]